MADNDLRQLTQYTRVAMDHIYTITKIYFREKRKRWFLIQILLFFPVHGCLLPLVHIADCKYSYVCTYIHACSYICVNARALSLKPRRYLSTIKKRVIINTRWHDSSSSSSSAGNDADNERHQCRYATTNKK